MEIHGTRVIRLPHHAPARGQAKPRPAPAPAAAPPPPAQRRTAAPGAQAETRAVHPDHCSPQARHAIAAYLRWGRPEVPDTLVRLDCYA